MDRNIWAGICGGLAIIGWVNTAGNPVTPEYIVTKIISVGLFIATAILVIPKKKSKSSKS